VIEMSVLRTTYFRELMYPEYQLESVKIFV
jgi:hypothetical protein